MDGLGFCMGTDLIGNALSKVLLFLWKVICVRQFGQKHLRHVSSLLCAFCASGLDVMQHSASADLFVRPVMPERFSYTVLQRR